MAAAAVVVVAVIGINLVPKTAGVGGPAAPDSTPIPLPSAGPLAAGTYVMTPFAGNVYANACETPPQSGCIETAADDTIRISFHRPGWRNRHR